MYLLEEPVPFFLHWSKWNRGLRIAQRNSVLSSKSGLVRAEEIFLSIFLCFSQFLMVMFSLAEQLQVASSEVHHDTVFPVPFTPKICHTHKEKRKDLPLSYLWLLICLQSSFPVILVFFKRTYFELWESRAVNPNSFNIPGSHRDH